MWLKNHRPDPLIKVGVDRHQDSKAHSIDDGEGVRRPSRLVAVVGIGIVVVWVASLVVQ